MARMLMVMSVVLVVACSCVSSRGRLPFKFPLPPPPMPAGCVHRGSFFEVGETFADKWCSKSCMCKEEGVIVCSPICPMEWVECGEGLRPKVYLEPVMRGMCTCPRHVCVGQES